MVLGRDTFCFALIWPFVVACVKHQASIDLSLSLRLTNCLCLRKLSIRCLTYLSIGLWYIIYACVLILIIICNSNTLLFCPPSVSKQCTSVCVWWTCLLAVASLPTQTRSSAQLCRGAEMFFIAPSPSLSAWYVLLIFNLLIYYLYYDFFSIIILSKCKHYKYNIYYNKKIVVDIWFWMPSQPHMLIVILGL